MENVKQFYSFAKLGLIKSFEMTTICRAQMTDDEWKKFCRAAFKYEAELREVYKMIFDESLVIYFDDLSFKVDSAPDIDGALINLLIGGDQSSMKALEKQQNVFRDLDIFIDGYLYSLGFEKDGNRPNYIQNEKDILAEKLNQLETSEVVEILQRVSCISENIDHQHQILFYTGMMEKDGELIPLEVMTWRRV